MTSSSSSSTSSVPIQSLQFRKQIRRRLIKNVYIRRLPVDRSVRDRKIYNESFQESSFIFSVLTEENKIDLQNQVDLLVKKTPLPKYHPFQILDKYEEDIIVECGLSLRLKLKFSQIEELYRHPISPHSYWVNVPWGCGEPDAEVFIPFQLYQAWYSREILYLTDFSHTQFLGTEASRNWLETTFSSDALLAKLIRHITIWNQDWPGLLNLLSVSKTLNKRILNIGKTDQNLIQSLRKEMGAFSVVTKSARSNLIPILKKVRNKVTTHLVACEYCYKIFYCDYSTFECVMEDPLLRKLGIFNEYRIVYHASDAICDTIRKRKQLLSKRLASSIRNGRRYKIGGRGYLPRLTRVIEETEVKEKQNKKKRKWNEEQTAIEMLEEEEEKKNDEDEEYQISPWISDEEEL